jgi:ABC-2 type transport system ATP-binding protein
MEKVMRCPKCKKILKFNGIPGETQNINCPFCGSTGAIKFNETETFYKESFVKIENLSKKYKQLLALNDVSLHIKEGGIFGYIGPNGAGKTTTIKILVGLLKQTKGSVYINGYIMPEQKEKAHSFIGYMPQIVAFQQWRTAHHALLTFGKLSGLDSRNLQNRIDEILELLKLTSFKNKKIKELSGGTIQKLGIAQALIHNPKLLILDEPLSGLDPESRFQVKKILKDLSSKGTTIFFSSHILSDVQDVATKICILDWGRILKIGSLDELKNEFSTDFQIELVLSKKSKRFDDIKAISGVKEIIEKSSKKFIIHLTKGYDTDEVIHNIITQLLNNNCRISSITQITPTLDEIYQFYLRRGVIKQ